jgi:hypothetical protein
MGVRDFVAKLPLQHVSYTSRQVLQGGGLRLSALQGSEIGLDTVVLVELGLHIVVDVLELLLKVLDEFPKRSVSPVADFVPLESA